MTVKKPNDNPLPPAEHEHVRTGTSPRALKAAFEDNLNLVVGRPLEISTAEDRYRALALSVRDRIMQRWIKQVERWNGANLRQVSYLSAEFLMGPHLGKEMLNLGITEHARQAMTELGLDLDQFIGLEEEPGLGNGGLGRLAACYLDSLATVGYPAIGYGIRYEFGIFDQIIKDGWQVEVTDKWLRFGNVWEVARPHFAQVVKLGGYSEHYTDERGADRVRWVPGRVVVGTPYEIPPFSDTAWKPAPCCACGAPRPPNPSILQTSTAAIITERYTKKSIRKISPKSSTPMTSSYRANICVSNSNTSSSPARSRT